MNGDVVNGEPGNGGSKGQRQAGLSPAQSAAALPTATATAARGSLLEARDLFRSFGNTPALQGASLSVAQGEVLAVMGPSGSGKSTLLHCLAGIYTPDRGEVWFDGRRVDSLNDNRRTEMRRTAFGFVFQFGQLVPELTALDNIALPLLLGKVRRKQAYETAQSWLVRLGLDELGARRTGELSGGQAQRVAIGRALATRPKVLFADEPTGALDSLTGEKVMDLLVSTARQEGTTVVVVTHDARVAACADREVMVRDGRVAAGYGAAAAAR
ncbi:MAG TPA: ABC transporter ATP-binding protein [Actinocrinis sp.]|nr:ABC transporter ATP-binding protein [Actinocrinis sp.]